MGTGRSREYLAMGRVEGIEFTFLLTFSLMLMVPLQNFKTHSLETILSTVEENHLAFLGF